MAGQSVCRAWLLLAPTPSTNREKRQPNPNPEAAWHRSPDLRETADRPLERNETDALLSYRSWRSARGGGGLLVKLGADKSKQSLGS